MIKACENVDCTEAISKFANDSGSNFFSCVMNQVQTNCQNVFDPNFDECKQMGFYQCSRDEGQNVDFRLVKNLATCGNGIVEFGEACDDGNTLGFDTCAATCKVLFPPETFAEYYGSPIKIIVKDDLGNTIPLITVKVYYSLDEIAFPYNRPSDDRILIVGETDFNGEFTIPNHTLPMPVLNSGLGKWQNMIHFEVYSKFGNYIPSAWPNRLAEAQLTVKPTEFIMVATEKFEYPKGSITEKELHPFKVSLSPEFLDYQRTHRAFYIPYTPILRDDLKAKVQQMDITLNIVDQQNTGTLPNGMTQNAPVGTLIQYTRTHLHSSRRDFFEVSIPNQGTYYIYFTANLTFQNGQTSTFSFYPPHAYGWTLKEPNFLPPSSMDKSFEGAYSTVSVYPGALENINGLLAAAVPGHNDSNEKRLNLVFINQGFEETVFSQMVENSITANGQLSFSQVEPFQSNLSRFNFWKTVGKSFTAAETSWNFGDQTKKKIGDLPLSFLERMHVSLGTDYIGNVYYIVLSNNDFSLGPDDSLQAGVGKCAFHKGILMSIPKIRFSNCLQTNSVNTCLIELDYFRSLMHEFGHLLGHMGEEYYEQNLLVQSDAMKNLRREYSSVIKPNISYDRNFQVSKHCTDFTQTYLGKSTLYSEIFKSNFDGMHCLASSQLSCEETPWNDLIGNGCGLDGVIDCSPSDPDYSREVRCELGGGLYGAPEGFANVFKPSVMTIMQGGYLFNSANGNWTVHDRPFGHVGERALCQNIQKQAQVLPGGICDSLCLNGCPYGQRCVQGACTPVATTKVTDNDLIKMGIH